MAQFEVWSEGYQITGNSGTALYHGEFPGETFKDAVRAFRDSLAPDTQDYVSVNNLTYWGCRLYPSERQARRSFG